MIHAGTLIAHFRRMLAEKWSYVWGAAREGTVDCSGAFVWAYGQEGEQIYQGSNRIARVYVERLLPTKEAAPAMAAFKAKAPSEKGYALPQGYMPGGGQYNGDLNDYYHIGLVDTDPAFVLEAKGKNYGFVRSRLSEWDFVARLKDVLYEEDNAVGAKVVATSGGTVRMRGAPSMDAETLQKIPVGDTVEVVAEADGWSTIVTSNGEHGYMMSKYLETIGDETKTVSLTLRVETAKEIIAALEKALKGV